jgi:hypothetical protein
LESLATILGDIIRTKLGIRREIVLTALTRLFISITLFNLGFDCEHPVNKA